MCCLRCLCAADMRAPCTRYDTFEETPALVGELDAPEAMVAGVRHVKVVRADVVRDASQFLEEGCGTCAIHPRRRATAGDVHCHARGRDAADAVRGCVGEEEGS